MPPPPHPIRHWVVLIQCPNARDGQTDGTARQGAHAHKEPRGRQWRRQNFVIAGAQSEHYNSNGAHLTGAYAEGSRRNFSDEMLTLTQRGKGLTAGVTCPISRPLAPPVAATEERKLHAPSEINHGKKKQTQKNRKDFRHAQTKNVRMPCWTLYGRDYSHIFYIYIGQPNSCRLSVSPISSLNPTDCFPTGANQ